MGSRHRVVPLVVLVLLAAGCGGGDRASTTTTTAAVTTRPVVSTSTPPPPPAWWKPPSGTTFFWQLDGTVDPSKVDAQAVDVDGFDTSAETVVDLHARGAKVICYLSAGSHEDWRPDAAEFPASVLGAPVDDWAGERWLDVRRIDVLQPIMERRMDMCRSKGFDAVEADNVDAYTNRSGFPLSAQDQLAYNTMLADAAHARGLSIGLKNDLDQVAALEPRFDFAVNEQCHEYDECAELAPFVRADKAVFNVEYESCPSSVPAGFSTYLMNAELDGTKRDVC